MVTGRSTASLLGDLVNQVTDLFRTELRLFKVEIDEKVSQAKRAVIFIAVGGVLLFAALIVLLDAAVEGLAATGLARYWAALIVGLVVVAIGGGLVLKALSDLKPEKLKPQRSLTQLGKDVAVVKGQVR